MNNKKISGLYAITHHDHFSQQKLIKDVNAALEGGASIIQFRDKHSNTLEKEIRANALKTLCAQYNALFIINDDIELCKKINADGVHLGLKDTSIKEARLILGEKKVIGATCHNSLPQAKLAQKAGADYIALGKFFASKTKNEAPLADISCISLIMQEC